MDINGPLNLQRAKLAMVWYSGTDALKQGEGVCYNTDYATTALPVTAIDASRMNRVERPTSSNNRAFAGVAARDYSAQSGGQFVEIFEPGSVCLIALGADTVINTGMLTAQANGGSAAGRFSDQGFPGRGSAIPLQTVTAVLESVKTGAGSLLATDGKTLTVSDSSDFSVGDTVVLLAMEDDGTGVPVEGKYLIGSITDGTTIVLATAALSTLSTGAITCSYYVYTGNPKCLARLLDGEESGLVEWITPRNTGTTGVVHMVGGVTYINGGVTVGSADDDVTFADGTIYGELKGFKLMGTLTTQAVCIDLATNGIKLNGGALAEINTLAAAGDNAFLQWTGLWRTVMVQGSAAEA